MCPDHVLLARLDVYGYMVEWYMAEWLHGCVHGTLGGRDIETKCDVCMHHKRLKTTLLTSDHPSSPLTQSSHAHKAHIFIHHGSTGHLACRGQG